MSDAEELAPLRHFSEPKPAPRWAPTKAVWTVPTALSQSAPAALRRTMVDDSDQILLTGTRKASIPMETLKNKNELEFAVMYDIALFLKEFFLYNLDAEYTENDYGRLIDAAFFHKSYECFRLLLQRLEYKALRICAITVSSMLLILQPSREGDTFHKKAFQLMLLLRCSSPFSDKYFTRATQSLKFPKPLYTYTPHALTLRAFELMYEHIIELAIVLVHNKLPVQLSVFILREVCKAPNGAVPNKRRTTAVALFIDRFKARRPLSV